MLPKDSIPFLYQDDHWLVVHKPTGLSTHAANTGDLGLAGWIELHHHLKIHVCSRLDKGTSGVLVFALTALASARAQKIHTQETARKVYHFISDKKHATGNKWICRKKLDEASCKTAFELVESKGGYYLYRAEISRGKTHQIRRHATESGVAILGDDEYCGTDFSRLCLHCSEVVWPEIKQKLSLDLPESFRGLLLNKDQLVVQAAVAAERRLDWISGISNAFRVVHRGEIMGLPFAIDIYDAWMCVTGYDEKISAVKLKDKLMPMLDALSQRYKLKGGIIKSSQQDPHRQKLFGDSVTFGEPLPELIVVREHDLVYEVRLNDSQHTGLFLDQRDSRRRLSQITLNKRVANLFAFTCSFSVVAAQGGAEVVFSVDLAAGALERGKNNFSRNNLDILQCGKFIQKDVRSWLAKQLKSKNESPPAVNASALSNAASSLQHPHVTTHQGAEDLPSRGGFKPWDVVICDPPVFAVTGRGHSFSVLKMWPELSENISNILSPDGIALFANNHRKGNNHYYLNELKKHFSRVTQLRPPFDFPEIKDAPAEVRIFLCQL
ncbi:MAG: class I SAM-dependent methyltransferase [Deltaproteobacteria bacterium]|nr:class I SAM-dependent methyltransferase [Deltaproteobacteria bacterium]